MKFDIGILKEYEKEKWIYSHYHKELPLIIWNYSQFTQYEGKWDDITLHCRGLITDLEGNIISKGFKKFFNYSEGKANIPENIKTIKVYNKMDGSYIGVFNYKGQWIINSKGSFYSDQVVWAKEIIEKQSILDALDGNYTYCFELIHPENRIVVDYKGIKTLSLLAVFNKGLEVEEELDRIERGWNISVPGLQVFSNFEPKRLKEINFENQEGYVVKFQNGERCKIKFDEYIRLHSIVTNTTSYDIWNCLKDGDDFEEILDRTPDEFNLWIKKTKIEIEGRFNIIKGEILTEYLNLIDIPSDKYFAEIVKYNSYRHPLFSLRNNKSIDKWVWEKCKPKFKKAFQI